MSLPSQAEDVKLIASLFSPGKALIDQIIDDLEQLYGSTDWVSPELYFDRTRYYAREMGWPLHRRFVAFKRVIRPEAIADIKLATNKLESNHLQGGKRLVNIDPGYISLERLVLATGKNYTHRIYLNKGIYADLTLIFHKESFRPLDWTYRDYRDPIIIDYFNGLRERYKDQIRGISRDPEAT
ncbi:DUF4416 family protein [Thermodesulfobacteriota bacterium]